MNMIRQQASIVNNSRSLSDIGIVTGYNPDTYSVTVELYPETADSPSLQTGFIPLQTPWAGDGWGLFAPPNIGDMIEIHYPTGSLQTPYASLRNFNFGSRPLSVPSGEFWLVHQTGSFIKLTNDGNLAISSTTVINVTAPVVNIDSAEVNLGSGTLGALLSATAATAFDNHTHTGSFSGVTSTPSTSMATDVTANVFGS